MMRAALILPVLVAGVPASAQTVTALGTATVDGSTAPVRKLLADGYDVKAGFSDNNGGAYMVLQKATSAYLCHSGAAPTCDKLN